MRALWLLLFVSLPSFAQNIEDRVADADRGYHQVLLACPQRIWPGMDWSKTQFLLASDKLQKAWLISAQAPSAEVLPLTEVPAVAFRAPYSFLEFRGITTVTIGLDSPFFDENTTPFALAVHEMFHHAGQKGWKSPEGSRGTLVPLDFKPRYIRAEILSSLKSQLDTGSGLNAAADWYAEWTRGYPSEVASTTDGYEGTASYVESVAGIFKKISCAASDGELFAAMRAESARFALGPGNQLDGEGYPLGALAGYLLDMQGVEWKSAMPVGKTPVSVLLEGKSSAVPVANPALERKYETTYSKMNAEIDLWKTPFESKLASADYVRVAVPGKWVQGSYSPKGFYIPAASPAMLYTPFSGEHRFFSGAGEFITVADSVVGFTNEAAKECEGAAWYVLVAKSDLTAGAGGYSVQTEEIQMETGGDYKTGRDGLDYLCSHAR